MVYIHVLSLGRYFTKFGIPMGALSETKEPKFKNWVYFVQITVKSPEFGKIGAFSIKNGILMGG